MDSGLHKPTKRLQSDHRRFPEHAVCARRPQGAKRDGKGFTDKSIELFMQDKLAPVDAAMAKMTTSELHCEAVDKCLQLFCGWG